MSRMYVYSKATGFSNPVGLARLMAAAGTRVVSGRGPFQLTQDGDQVGGDCSRLEVLSRFRKAISHREVGSTFRIRKGDSEVCFTARAVMALDDSDTTNGNERSDTYYNWIRATQSQYDPRYAGSYVCKHIAGSTTMSQHSYGNAVDFFFDTLAHQDNVADSVVAHADELHVFTIISRQRIWIKGEGWRAYGGEFHGHLHVDFDPQYSGACGVRNG